MFSLLLLADQLHGIDPSALAAVVGPALSAHGVELVDATFRNERGWVLRLSVDLPSASQSVDLPIAAQTASAGSDAPSAIGGPSMNADPLRPVGGATITLAEISQVSKAVSAALDATDVIPYRYTLEVSSPGPDRPLRGAADFLRFTGRLAKLYLARPASDGQRVLRGHLRGITNDAVTVLVDGNAIAVPFGDVTRAHLIFEVAPNGLGKRPKKRIPGASRGNHRNQPTFEKTEPQAKEER